MKMQKVLKNKLVDIILLRLNKAILGPCQRRAARFDTCFDQGNLSPTAEYELYTAEVELLQRDEMRIAVIA